MARKTDDIEGEVVTAALDIAEAEGWPAVRLHRIADRTGLPLERIGARFRDVDAIADRWFDRARAALLATPEADLAGRTGPERLAVAIERWLDALEPHRRATLQMLKGKLYPSHPQHWVPLVFSLSRLVHDILDVARLAGDGRRRQAQEVTLTLVMLATLAQWARDRSEGQARSRAGLRRRLRRSVLQDA